MKAGIFKLMMSLTVVATVLFAQAPPALAACGAGQTGSGKYVLDGVGKAGGNKCDDKGVTNILSTIVNILSYFVGVAAIIVIIISGFRYITSAGDSGRVGAAKNTLIYALVGVIIAGLAQFLVHFVLNRAGNTG